MGEDPEVNSIHALIDTRTVQLRDKDYSTEELPLAGGVEAFKNTKILKPKATEYNQWYVGSCVPHGIWTQLEYEGIIPPDFGRPAQLRSYRKRSNYPAEGSNGVDMYDRIRDGQSNDFPTPEKFREAQATAMPYVKGDKLIKDFKYYQYIDKATGMPLLHNVPQDVAAGKAIAIFIFATRQEWSKEYVEVIDTSLKASDAEVRHCVCLIPLGDFTENGKRWMAVQDSAKFGGRGIRYIEYDKFFLTRTYFAAKVYLTGTIPAPVETPTTTPTTVCELGARGAQVTALQNFLVKEGKLEKEYVTGYYGALTAKAVLWWQLEHWNDFSAKVPQILEWVGRYWGNESIAIVNKK